MKNFKKLSRDDQKKMIAGDIGSAYCFEGEGPGTGGCATGYICSGGKYVPYIGNPGGGDTCICP